jgi:hypothetical protein
MEATTSAICLAELRLPLVFFLAAIILPSVALYSVYSSLLTKTRDEINGAMGLLHLVSN